MAVSSESYRDSVVLLADGVVGTSGAETLLFSVTVKGGTATTRALIYAGTDTSGTLREDAIAPINDTVPIFYSEKGLYFPAGVYLDITTTGGTVTFTYVQ